MFIRRVELMDGNNRGFPQAPMTWAKAVHWVPSPVAVWRRFQDFLCSSHCETLSVSLLEIGSRFPFPNQCLTAIISVDTHTGPQTLRGMSKMGLVRFCSRFDVQPLTKLRWFKIDGRIFAFLGSNSILRSSRWNLIVISIAAPSVNPETRHSALTASCTAN